MSKEDACRAETHLRLAGRLLLLVQGVRGRAAAGRVRRHRAHPVRLATCHSMAATLDLCSLLVE